MNPTKHETHPGVNIEQAKALETELVLVKSYNPAFLYFMQSALYPPFPPLL